MKTLICNGDFKKEGDMENGSNLKQTNKKGIYEAHSQAQKFAETDTTRCLKALHDAIYRIIRSDTCDTVRKLSKEGSLLGSQQKDFLLA